MRVLLALFLSTLAAPLWADTVWLNNGDRLSGEIILLDGGKLALKTKYAGQVLIDWKDIDTLSSDKPLLVRRWSCAIPPGCRRSRARQSSTRYTIPNHACCAVFWPGCPGI